MITPYPSFNHEQRGRPFLLAHPYHTYHSFSSHMRPPPSYVKKKNEQMEHSHCLNSSYQETNKFLNSTCTNSNKNDFSSECIDTASNTTDEQVFEIFGIKLASDDLLILALLFFLYKEEVKDIYLYITLILLLIS